MHEHYNYAVSLQHRVSPNSLPISKTINRVPKHTSVGRIAKVFPVVTVGMCDSVVCGPIIPCRTRIASGQDHRELLVPTRLKISSMQTTLGGPLDKSLASTQCPTLHLSPFNRKSDLFV